MPIVHQVQTHNRLCAKQSPICINQQIKVHQSHVTLGPESSAKRSISSMSAQETDHHVISMARSKLLSDTHSDASRRIGVREQARIDLQSVSGEGNSEFSILRHSRSVSQRRLQTGERHPGARRLEPNETLPRSNRSIL